MTQRSRKERIEQSPQWNAKKKKFSNRLAAGMSIAKMAKASAKFALPKKHRRPEKSFELVNPSATNFSENDVGNLKVTWLGHSSIILQIDGSTFLFDPVWSERVSFLKRVGPKRFHAPPLALADLPKIDAVVISHDHYDHFDHETILFLANETDVKFLIPLGVGGHFDRWGIDNTRYEEFDWWENVKVNSITLTACPARHSSGRNGKTDKTLWVSWALSGPQRSAFFGGDSAMHDDFEEIGKRCGPFDLTMLECGAYNDAWSFFHMGPEQSVEAHLQLKGKTYLPIHWGTFDLALHVWTEPIERVLVAVEEKKVNCITPKIGATTSIPQMKENQKWWPRDIDWSPASETPIISPNLNKGRSDE